MGGYGEWTRERKGWLQDTIRGMGDGGGQTGIGPGEGQPGAVTPSTGCCHPYVPSLKGKRNRIEGDIFVEREVFLLRERETSPKPLSPSHGNKSPGQPRLGRVGRGVHTLEPMLFPSREPGAQREGTAHPGRVRDSATGSGKAALCQCPKLQGLLAAGGGGALLQPLGTWLSQMPQPGSMSGTCIRAFCISVKS